MSIKKISALILTAVMATGILSGCGSSSEKTNSQGKADSGKSITLRLADNQTDNYVTVRADKKFAQLVSEKTNGKIKIDVYSGGQLGDEKTAIEQVQFGAIDLIRCSISPLSEFDKELGVLMLPYIYRDRDHMFKVLDGEIGDKFLNDLNEYKLQGLCWFDSGARNFYNSKKEIKSPADLKGLKIRVQESKVMMDLVKALGASPTPMAYSEVYSGLQTKVIDGAENNWPSYTDTSHYEVAKYITEDGHTRVPEMIIASKMTFDKLSDEDKKILKDCAVEAAKFEREEWLKDEKAAKDKAIANGNKVTELKDNSAFRDAVKPLYDELGKNYKDVIDKIINTK